MKTKKIILPESQMPTQWYNIVSDMKNRPLPPLNPATKEPVTLEQMSALFAEELMKQEMSTERYIDIPEEVQDLYKIYRSTPLVRAYGLEKALDTPAKIYFKNESVSPVGSHKTNTAIPQAYYNYKQGIRHLTTETGAGQWGAAMSMATQHFGIDLKVFMVKVSFNQKPYRKLMMNTWGADVYASPSEITAAGRAALAKNPNDSGSLGMAISEAVEMALQNPQDTRYCLGSVLNHVLLHQTIIGEEAVKQMELFGEYPDVVIGCFGGGSNFAGISFSFLRDNLTKGKNTRVIAVEPQSCPKLTRGEFQYDFGDVAGFTPLLPMYTLGHNFHPSDIHAGGLRYHGAGRSSKPSPCRRRKLWPQAFSSPVRKVSSRLRNRLTPSHRRSAKRNGRRRKAFPKRSSSTSRGTDRSTYTHTSSISPENFGIMKFRTTKSAVRSTSWTKLSNSVTFCY